MKFLKPNSKISLLSVSRKSGKEHGLNSFNGFEDWYNTQEKVCYYCGLKEEESQEIVMRGLLKSNRFPQKGELARGRSRGMWLEVDRLNQKEIDSKENFVLCCYFCKKTTCDIL